jgi:hypothetical protein
MMRTIDLRRMDAFMRLLAQPDPTDLPRRGHVYRCEGDPNRRATRLPGILMAWLQRRILEHDADGLLASAAYPATGLQARRIQTDSGRAQAARLT